MAHDLSMICVVVKPAKGHEQIMGHDLSMSLGYLKKMARERIMSNDGSTNFGFVFMF